MGWKQRAWKSERLALHRQSDRDRAGKGNWLGSSRKYQRLDARQQLGLASSRSRGHRNLLDQHPAKSTAVGSKQSWRRQQCADHSRAESERPRSS